MSRQLWRRLDGRDRFHGWPRIKRRWEPTSASMLAGMSVSRIPRRLAAAATIQVGAGRLREDRSKKPTAPRQDVSAQGSALKVTIQAARAKARNQVWTSLIMMCGSRLPPLSVPQRSDEHTSDLPTLMRISYAVFC